MSRAERPVWTPEMIRALGVAASVPTIGEVFGMSRSQAYAAVEAGSFPVRVIRIGRRMVVPVADVLAVLGLEPAGGTAIGSEQGGRLRAVPA